MDYGGSVVTYVIIWWLVFFCLLPIGVRTAEEEGGQAEIGHATSAPTRPMIGRKMLIATVVAAILFGFVYAIVELELFSFREWTRGAWG